MRARFIFLFFFLFFLKSTTAAEYAGGNLRDPFSEVASSTSAPGASSSALVLDGIILNPKKPLAIINGKLSGVGEKINGSEVVEINRENVKISTNGQQFLLERKGKKI